MRLGDGRRESDFEINVIPLIDVLLTLLMFFVLTTTFVRHARLQVQLPTASLSAPAPATKPLVVMIDRRGNYYVDGQAVASNDALVLQRAIAKAAGPGHSRDVTLRADARASHQSVVTVMDVLGRLGFSHLSMATTHVPAPGN